MCIPNSSLNRGTPKRKPSDIYRNASRLHFSIYIHTHTHISQLTSAPARDSPTGHSKTDSADCDSVAEGDETTCALVQSAQTSHHSWERQNTHVHSTHRHLLSPIMSQTHVHLLYFVGIIEGITGQAILLTDVITKDRTQKTGK